MCSASPLEADLTQAAVELRQPSAGNPRHHEVLVVRGAHDAGTQRCRKRADGAELRGGDVAERQLHGGTEVTSLLLLVGIGAYPMLEWRVLGLGQRRRRLARPCRREAVHHLMQLGTQCAALFLLDLREQAVDFGDEALRAEALEDVLHARLLPILALAEPVLQAHDGFRHDQRVLGGNEVAHRPRQEAQAQKAPSPA